MRILINYLEFLCKSTNQYGVHSPFVYHFLIDGLYKKADKTVIKSYELYRNQLLKSSASININDFGAGSKVFKSSVRPVKKMALWSGMSPKKAKIFQRILQYFQPQTVLELGTHLGLSTKIIINSLPNSKITTIEGCAATHGLVKALNALNQAEHLNLTFEEFLSTNTTTFDFIFLDGNHQKDATIQYVEMLLAMIANHGVIVIDDIYWNDQMKSAWQTIISLDNVTVSIDLFYFGLIFVRKEQVKQHFVIRG